MAEHSDKVVHGSCACGQIKVKVTGEPTWANLCYCSDCRKSTGAVFGAFLAYPKENFEISFPADAADALRTYTHGVSDSGSDRRKVKSFCGQCGSVVSVRGENNAQTEGLVAVPMGILDVEVGDSDPTPSLELYCKRRPKWLAGVEGGTSFHAMPDGPFYS